MPLGRIYREKSPDIYRERIFALALFNWRIRCWVPYMPDHDLDRLKSELQNFVTSRHQARDVKDTVALECLSKWDINAIEINEPDGQGVVFYADWP